MKMSKAEIHADQIPSIGLGTWKVHPESAGAAVVEAVRMGYRHIDCASTYGNEKQIGKALGHLIRQGVARRDELWITSKLPNTAHAAEAVLPAVEKSLGDLGLDYLDAYLVHWPIALREGVWIPRKAEHLVSLDEQPLDETWSAMEQLVDRGLVRQIGVSNFSILKLEQISSSCRIHPAINQVELHPYLQQREMLHYCKKKGIQLVAYSPLGSGDRPKPLKRRDEPVLLNDPLIGEIAAAHGVAASQVLLGWALQRGTIAIAKSVNPERLKSNLNADQLILSDEEMIQMETLDRHYRYVDGSFWVLPNGPYTLSNLWDE